MDNDEPRYEPQEFLALTLERCAAMIKQPYSNRTHVKVQAAIKLTLSELGHEKSRQDAKRRKENK